MKVVVIGEICKDVFIYGKCDRMSPEAPIPVFIPQYSTDNLGMSGNVIANIQSISDYEIIGIHNQNTITKTRYVDGKSNHLFLRVDEGEEMVESLKLNEELRNIIKTADITIVSDYDKGFLDNNTLFDIGFLSKMSIIDTKKILTPQLIEIYNFIKLNRDEFRRNVEHFDHTKGKIDNLYHKTIITEGMDGAKFQGIRYPSVSPKETIDVSGAGDTFTASFIIKYMETFNIEESIVYANEMSSIVVSKRGVSTPYEV